MLQRNLGTLFSAPLITILIAGASSTARADLAPAFAGKITVDTAYVTQAAQATDVAFSGDGRAVVTTKGGSIVIRHADGTRVTVAYPFGGTLDTSAEKGVIGVVADPAVAQNRAFYFYVSNGPTEDKNRVYRAVLGTGDTLAVDAQPIIAASRGLGPGLEGPGYHNGGGMFISGGRLFVGVGDTGANATPPTNKVGSCLNKGNGKLLRVNLDGTIPTDNPLVGVTSVTACAGPNEPWTTGTPDRRIYAWGLRNPWRFWVDGQTGLTWIGDVGETTEEEISIGGAGVHHGYPFVEGAHVWGNVDGMSCTTMTPSRACTPPPFSYTHDVGSAVTGGLIPEGCGWTNALGGSRYLLGDSSAGWMRLLPVNATRTGFASTTPIEFATYDVPVSFRMGPDQSLYAVLFGAGAVYRFAPTTRTGPDCGSAAVPASSPVTVVVLSLGLLAAALVCLRARGSRGRSPFPTAR